MHQTLGILLVFPRFMKAFVSQNELNQSTPYIMSLHSMHYLLPNILDQQKLSGLVTSNDYGGPGQYCSNGHGKQDADLQNAEYVLTYEDKDGDWMLVGDVPWR